MLRIIANTILAVVVPPVLLVLYRVGPLLWHSFRSPLRRLQGPVPTHFLFGGLNELASADGAAFEARWLAAYGPTMGVPSFFHVR